MSETLHVLILKLEYVLLYYRRFNVYVFSYQLRICHVLVTSVCRDFSIGDQRVDAMSKFCFACMEYLSSVLRGKLFSFLCSLTNL